MNPSRLHHLTSAFRDKPLRVGQYTLRPLTAGTVMLLMDSGNALFSDQEQEPTEAQAMQALFEFIWIHVGPEDEVIRQCDDPASLRAAARAFALGISFEDLEDFNRQFAGARADVNAAMVEVIPEKGEATKKPDSERLPPTGSPPLSTTSEAVETLPESTGSSGGCPSPGLSNTSTPPMPQTTPGPSGKSPIWEEPIQEAEEQKNVIPIG